MSVKFAGDFSSDVNPVAVQYDDAVVMATDDYVDIEPTTGLPFNVVYRRQFNIQMTDDTFLPVFWYEDRTVMSGDRSHPSTTLRMEYLTRCR